MVEYIEEYQTKHSTGFCDLTRRIFTTKQMVVQEEHAEEAAAGNRENDVKELHAVVEDTVLKETEYLTSIIGDSHRF